MVTIYFPYKINAMLGLIPSVVFALSCMAFLAKNIDGTMKKQSRKKKVTDPPRLGPPVLNLGPSPLGPQIKNKKERGKLPPPNNLPGVHSQTEEECRKIMEEAFRAKFPPLQEFVVNPTTGRWLTLDGYNSDLRIGFEYQGKQHYDFPNYFHKTEKEFRASRFRDRFKKAACQKAGIKLIIISYKQNNRLREFINLEAAKIRH